MTKKLNFCKQIIVHFKSYINDNNNTQFRESDVDSEGSFRERFIRMIQSSKCWVFELIWVCFTAQLLNISLFNYMHTYSCGQNFTYTLQNLQNGNYFTKIRGIIQQNACYFLFSNDLNKIFHIKGVYM